MVSLFYTLRFKKELSLGVLQMVCYEDKKGSKSRYKEALDILCVRFIKELALCLLKLATRV